MQLCRNMWASSKNISIQLWFERHVNNILDKIKHSKRKNIIPIGFILANNKIYLSLKDGRIILADIINGKSIDIIKIANSRISRPHVQNEYMYLIKDNAIIKIN